MKVAKQMKFATMDDALKFIEQNQSAPLSELDTIDLGGILDNDWSDDVKLDFGMALDEVQDNDWSDDLNLDKVIDN